ncbi:hypothetical protein OG900_07420 [Streptomyces sp. NBC_00433]
MAMLTGCGVPVDAVAGISVTDDGHLLGALMVCGHHIDGASLYADSEKSHRSVTVGSWTSDAPLATGLATWTLDAPAPGWTTTVPLAPLTSGTTYHLYGWTKDNSWSSSHVSFTSADRDRLSPGDIRYEDFSDDGAAVPTTEFQAGACKSA